MSWSPFDKDGRPIAYPPVGRGQSILFQPVGSDGDWHLNAIVDHFEDDSTLGFGYADAALTLVKKWIAEGPNDFHLMPIVLLYRHALELDLKVCIRAAAKLLEEQGMATPKEVAQLSTWLRREAGHNLARLAYRLDSYLKRLGTDQLPADLNAVIDELHRFDPAGDNFRYSTTYDPSTSSEINARRPAGQHADISRLGGILEQTHSYLSGGVYSWLVDALQDVRAANQGI